MLLTKCRARESASAFIPPMDTGGGANWMQRGGPGGVPAQGVSRRGRVPA